MAQQNAHQLRPFVTKETFDKVSAAMWGQNSLDYHTNYLIPRAKWEDSEIREEALYFDGLARGLRLGTGPAPSQPTMRQNAAKEQIDVLLSEAQNMSDYSNVGEAVLGDRIESVAPAQAYRFRQKQGHHLPTLPSDLNDFVYAPSPAVTEHVASNSGSGLRYNKHANAAGGLETGQIEKDLYTTSPPEQEYEPHLLRAQDTKSALDAVRLANAQQRERANHDAAERKRRELAGPFGVLSAPDWTDLNIPLTDRQANNAPEPHLSSQPMAAPYENSSLVHTTDFQSGNNDDEDYFKVYSSSSFQQDVSIEGGYDAAMEQWFEEQGAREW